MTDSSKTIGKLIVDVDFDTKHVKKKLNDLDAKVNIKINQGLFKEQADSVGKKLKGISVLNVRIDQAYLDGQITKSRAKIKDRLGAPLKLDISQSHLQEQIAKSKAKIQDLNITIPIVFVSNASDLMTDAAEARAAIKLIPASKTTTLKVNSEKFDKGIKSAISSIDLFDKRVTDVRNRIKDIGDINVGNLGSINRIAKVIDAVSLSEKLTDKQRGDIAVAAEKSNIKVIESNKKFAAEIEKISAKELANANDHARKLEVISQDRIDADERRYQATKRFSEKLFMQEKAKQNAIELIEKRAATRPVVKKSIGSQLATISNDLRGFEIVATRVLSGTAIAFAAWQVAVTAAVGAVVAYSITKFAELEQAVTQAGAILAGGDLLSTGVKITANNKAAIDKQYDEIVSYTNQKIYSASKEIALETLFSPRDIAVGARVFAQAGFNLDQLVSKGADGANILGTAAKFAQNELISVEEAVNVLAGSLNSASEQINATNFNKLTNQFTIASQSSQASAKDIADAFGNAAAGAFKTYGQSIEETIAVISLFGLANKRGRDAGSLTAITIRDVNKAFSKNSAAFKKYGVDLIDANGRAVPFTETLLDIADAQNKVGKQFGSQGIVKFRKELGLTEKASRGFQTLFPVLIQQGRKGVDALINNLRNFEGATERVSRQQTKTIAFLWQQLGETINNQLTIIGEKAAIPALKELLESLAGTGGEVTKLGKFLEGVGNNLGSFFKGVQEFLLSDDFTTGLKILYDSIVITIDGVKLAFVELGKQFSDFGESQSFFIAFASAIQKFSEAARAVIPKIAGFIGAITNLVIEHETLVTVLAKVSLGIIAVNFAIDKIGRPLSAFKTGIDGLIQPMALFAKKWFSIAAGMNAVVDASVDLKKNGAINAPTRTKIDKFGNVIETSTRIPKSQVKSGLISGASEAASAGLLGASFAGGKGVVSDKRIQDRVKGAFKGIDESIKDIGNTGQKRSALLKPFLDRKAIDSTFLAGSKAVKSFSAGISAASKLLDGFLYSLKGIAVFLRAIGKFTPIGAIIAGIEIAIGLVKGFGQGIKESIGMKGESGKEVREFFSFIKTSLKIATDILSVFGRVAADVGRFIGRYIGTAIRSLSKIFSGLKDIFSGDVVDGFKKIGNAIVSGFATIFANLYGLIVEFTASLIDSFKNIPLIGDSIGKAADKMRDHSKSTIEAARSLDVFGENAKSAEGAMESASSAADKTSSSLSGASKSAKAFVDSLTFTETQKGALASFKDESIKNNEDILKSYGVTLEQIKQMQILAGDNRLNAGTLPMSGFPTELNQEANAWRAVINEQVRATNAQKIFNKLGPNSKRNLEILAGGRKNVKKLWDAIKNGSDEARIALIKFNKVAIETARLNAIKEVYASSKSTIEKIRDQSAQEMGDGAFGYETLLGKGKKSKSEKLVDLGIKLRNSRIQEINQDAKKALANIDAIDKKYSKITSGPSGSVEDDITTGDGSATDKAKEVKTAAEKALEAVNKLTQKQLDKRASTLISKLTAGAAKGYKATAVEAEILRRVLPTLEQQIQKQTEAISQLDKALQDLQNTQLKGTKQFSDQAFEFDQSVKRLQLQRVDLLIGGEKEDSAAIKALDEQISAIQKQSERLDLVQSLELDPLKRKLEDTFNPVKELSFDEIIKKFNELSAKKSPLQNAIAGGEDLKALLEATIADAEVRFTEAGANVSQGLINGVQSKTNDLVESGKGAGDSLLEGVDDVMQFGSPSKTMIQRGVWAGQGFAQGVNSTNSIVMNAGVSTMWSFLSGMRNVYENRVQPFVTGIATWIKNNKGPISYDATLLRPAGEAMMGGFLGGLRDGFSEVKGWVRDVAPQLAHDTFPKDLFIERSARFLINNARVDSNFNPEDAFGDLMYSVSGGVDGASSLGFLHKSLSFADTLAMGKKIAAMYGMSITGRDEAAGHVVGSDHPKGLALDLSNSAGSDWSRSSRTPEMENMRLDLMPYLKDVFKQIIYAEKIYGVGGGSTGAGGSIPNSNPHNAHVHLAWQKAFGFSKDSGKIGGLVNIPGVAQDVLSAISTASQKYMMDPLLIAAVMKQESGFRKNVVSFDGGYGLMQLTSSGLVSAADSMGGRLDPEANALVGTKYLHDLINQLGSIKLGLSAYNSGPGGGERYGRVDVPNYVSSVLAFYEEFKKLNNKFGGAREKGGPILAGKNYLVGEKGPEIVSFSNPGYVYNNKETRSIMGSGVSKQAIINDNRVINVHSNTTDPEAVARIVDIHTRNRLIGVTGL